MWSRFSSSSPLSIAALGLAGAGLGLVHGRIGRGSRSAPSSFDAVYSADEVSRHNGVDGAGIWMTYAGSVYDLSDFVAEHPGGAERIKEGAGGALEPFWGYWAYHTSFKRAPNLLAKYRIGRLAREDQDVNDDAVEGEEAAAAQFYADDPKRGLQQIELVDRPWCSETRPQAMLTRSTNNDDFYVRNHAPVPNHEPGDHFEITFEGPQGDTSKMTLDSLQKRYKPVRIRSVLQCAGNRASEMGEIQETAFKGTPFEVIGVGMLGSATWAGVRLSDVLSDVWAAHLERDGHHDADIDRYHVEFEGADGYATSTPLRRILDRSYDAILALEMNRTAIPPDHGFPVRVLIPGVAGARSVKWVNRIRLQEKESDTCWQQAYYKHPSGDSIQEMPMQSVVLEKRSCRPGILSVKGIAWGGGNGNGISRVQVSSDGGSTWIDAKLEARPRDDDSNRRWEWEHWHCEVDADPSEAVMCKAFDGAGHEQPEKPWNPKGYLYNGWHTLK